MYVVKVADNFHYADESEQYTHGQFETWDAAVAAAKAVVDRSLKEQLDGSTTMTPSELFERYKMFGEDPFVVPVPEGQSFVAWEFAKARCVDICGGVDPEGS